MLQRKMMLCIISPQMSGYKKYFNNGEKND